MNNYRHFAKTLKKRKEFRDNQDDTDDYLKTRRCIVYIDLVYSRHRDHPVRQTIPHHTRNDFLGASQLPKHMLT